MDLRYENLKNKPKTFRAFTGLDVEEFQILLQAFTVAWERYVQQLAYPQMSASEITVVVGKLD